MHRSRRIVSTRENSTRKDSTSQALKRQDSTREHLANQDLKKQDSTRECGIVVSQSCSVTFETYNYNFRRGKSVTRAGTLGWIPTRLDLSGFSCGVRPTNCLQPILQKLVWAQQPQTSHFLWICTKGWKPTQYALLQITGRSVRLTRIITVPSDEAHLYVAQKNLCKNETSLDAPRLDVEETHNCPFAEIYRLVNGEASSLSSIQCCPTRAFIGSWRYQLIPLQDTPLQVRRQA